MQTPGVIPSYNNPILQGMSVDAGGTIRQQSNRQSVRFYPKRELEMCAVLNEAGTKVMRYDPKPIERLMVRIETPGDKNVFDDVANEYHKSEFFRQYEAYVKGGKVIGHPIDDCEQIQPTIAIDLKMFGVHTMEQLADAPAVVLDRLPSGMGHQYKHFAQQWCLINSPTGIHAVTNKLSEELSEAKAEIERLRADQTRSAREVMQLKNTVYDDAGTPVFETPIEDGVALPGAVDIEPPESATISMTPEEFKAKSKSKTK